MSGTASPAQQSGTSSPTQQLLSEATPEPEMSKERTTPKIEPKLAGQNNYAQWSLSIEQTLSLYDHGTGSVWDIVTGGILDPGLATTTKAKKSTDIGKGHGTST